MAAEPFVTYLDGYAAGSRRRRFEYVDASGAVVATKVRVDKPDGSKACYWEPVGTNAKALPLYRAADVADLPASATVVVVEGEACADALNDAGISAVGTLGASVDPGDDALAALSGRVLVLWADDDAPGRAHMERLATRLEKIATVALLDVRAPAGWSKAGKASGFDAADFLAGHTPEDVRALVATAQAFTPKRPYVLLDDFLADAHEVRWLLPGIVPDGGLSIFAGEPRSFKTMAALNLLLAVAGDGWALGHEPGRRGPVLYVTEEGSRSALADRLRHLRAALPPASPIAVMHRRGVTLTPAGFADVAEAAAELQPVVVVLDTLAKMMVGSENEVEAIRDALRPTDRLMAETGCAVVLIHHVSKMREGRLGNRLRGSSALWGACDAVVTFTRDTERGVDLPSGGIVAEAKDADPTRLRFRFEPDSFLLTPEDRPLLTLGFLEAEIRRRETAGEDVTAEVLRATFGAARATMFRRLDELVAAGRVRRDKGGIYHSLTPGLL